MANKTFKDLYEEELKKPTPAKRFVAEVAELTKRSEITVRMWLSGKQSPDELAKATIAAKFGVNADGLFPATSSINNK